MRALQNQHATTPQRAPDGEDQAIASHRIAPILKNPPSICSVGKNTYSIIAHHIRQVTMTMAIHVRTSFQPVSVGVNLALPLASSHNLAEL